MQAMFVLFFNHICKFIFVEYINIKIYQVVQRFGFRPISSTTSKQQPETFDFFSEFGIVFTELSIKIYMQYTLKPLDRKIKVFHMNKANVNKIFESSNFRGFFKFTT